MDSALPSSPRRLSASRVAAVVLVAIATLLGLMLGLIVVLAKVIGFFELGLSVDGNYFVATGLVLALSMLICTFGLCLAVMTQAMEYPVEDEEDCDDNLDPEEVERPKMYQRKLRSAFDGRLVPIFLDELEVKPIEQNTHQAKKRRAKRR